MSRFILCLVGVVKDNVVKPETHLPMDIKRTEWCAKIVENIVSFTWDNLNPVSCLGAAYNGSRIGPAEKTSSDIFFLKIGAFFVRRNENRITSVDNTFNLTHFRIINNKHNVIIT